MAGSRDVHRLHPVLHAVGEVDVLVEVDVRPEIDELDGCVLRADAVNAPEALDDADGIPMDVVVDHAVAVLQVLSFRNAVRAE